MARGRSRWYAHDIEAWLKEDGKVRALPWQYRGLYADLLAQAHAGPLDSPWFGALVDDSGAPYGFDRLGPKLGCGRGTFYRAVDAMIAARLARWRKPRRGTDQRNRLVIRRVRVKSKMFRRPASGTVGPEDRPASGTARPASGTARPASGTGPSRQRDGTSLLLRRENKEGGEGAADAAPPPRESAPVEDYLQMKRDGLI